MNGEKLTKGTVKDLTVHGCQMETVFPLQRGQRVRLQVHLDQYQPMQIDLGIVRWVTDGKAGIEFIHMADPDELHLRILWGLCGPPN